MALSHAVEHFGVDQAVIVYEDLKNPCVVAFREFLKNISFRYSEKSGTLEDDVCELLGGKLICYGFGTFVESILCLSSNAIAAYAFRSVESFPGLNKPSKAGIKEILIRKGLTLHVIRDSTPGYIQGHGWANTAEQRELMLTFPEQSLEITKA
jgi:hypothetical protein